MMGIFEVLESSINRGPLSIEVLVWLENAILRLEFANTVYAFFNYKFSHLI